MGKKERLIVIGNGMAGARFVEDLVARRGRDRFDIVVLGDDPYGNYNRILLSNVVAGVNEPKDIFLNPSEWYERNGISLRAGVRVHKVDRAKKLFVLPSASTSLTTSLYSPQGPGLLSLRLIASRMTPAGSRTACSCFGRSTIRCGSSTTL